MKMISLLLLILIIPLNVFSQKKTSRGDELLYKAHNDLYFTVYYFKDLADSLVERNLRKTFKVISAKNIDHGNISYPKYFAEYYYLKGYQAYNKNYDEITLSYLDSAKVSLENVLKIYNDKDKNNEVAIINCFIDNCSLNTLSESILTLKNNSLRRMMENLYLLGKNTTFNISQMNAIKKQFTGGEDVINTIYLFANSSVSLKQRDSIAAINFFNDLDNDVKIVNKNTTQAEIQQMQANMYNYKDLTDYSRRSEINCEDQKEIPDLYRISNYPKKQEFQILQNQLLSFCKQSTPEIIPEILMSNLFFMKGSQRVTFKELKYIPFTDESSQVTIPPIIFDQVKNKKLGSVDSLFVHYLKLGGYDPKENISYYSYKGGFAMLTSLEMIKNNGTPFSPQERFSLKKIKNNSIKEFFRTLFMGDKGYYRFIIFVVSAEDIVMSGSNKILTYSESNILFSLGTNELPEKIASTELTGKYNGKAFIYVFRKFDMAETPEFEVLSLSGHEQFKNSNLSNFLDK